MWERTQAQVLGAGVADSWVRARAAVSALLTAERERWFLWIPVAFGMGIALYFALPRQPPLGLSIGMFAVSVGIAAVVRRHAASRLIFAFLFVAVAAGVLRIDLATRLAEAPVLDRERYFHEMSGRVVALEAFPDGPRARLEELDLGRYRGSVPKAVRVKLRRGERPAVGSRIVLSARLGPPPTPSYPGAYDFARRAWFEQLGGVGFALSETRVIEEEAEPGWARRLGEAITVVRLSIAARILEAEPGPSGAVAVALLVGDRSSVPDVVVEDLRVAGLAHLLAISGLHIGMVSALVFFVLRMLLVSIGDWPLRYPVKKWAALGALFAAFGYLVLSGGTIPTQRAFLMTGLVFIAVLIDRKAISMRLVALAAGVVLLISPESLVGASFQLSFAAAMALVAVYEDVQRSQRFGVGKGLRADRGIAARVFVYIAAILLTTIVANAATAPFAIYHFERLASFGLIANLVAIPLVSLWIMPLGLLTLVMMPIGLEFLPLGAMAEGIDIVLWTAEVVADLPGAQTQVSEMPVWGLLLIAIGGIWLAVWRRTWRWLGLLPIIAGTVSIPTLAPPIAIISESGRQNAILDDSGLWAEWPRREKFALSVWSEKAGRPIAGDWIAFADRTADAIRCGTLGCTFRRGGVEIAFSQDVRSLIEDCRRADVVVSPVRVPVGLCGRGEKGKGGLRNSPQVIDPIALSDSGTHLIRLKGNRAVVETVQQHRGMRPWTGHR